VARGRKQLHLRRTGENRRIRRPTLREALREADRRARQRANQRSWRRRGLTSVQSAIADSHYAQEQLGWSTRSLRILAGLALLPLCFITTITLFNPHLHALGDTDSSLSVWQQVWRTNAFLYFSVGFILNVGWFFTRLFQPVFLYLYVLGHELTHVIFVYACLGRVSGFRVSLDGGHIVTNKSNILIALSPYFIPFWSVVTFILMTIIGLIGSLPHHEKILFGTMGATWSFHLLWTLWIIPRDQPDLKENGTFFSLSLIYLSNVLLLSALLCLASPELTWRHFVYNWANNFMDTVTSVSGTLD